MTEHGDIYKGEVPEEADPNLPHIHALTAFTVIVTEDGNSYAILEPPAGVAVQYMPTATSVRRACNEIVDDINCQVAAEYTFQKQEQQRFAQMKPASFRVAERLSDRAGKHSAEAPLANAFDAGVGDWIG
jgi:hypothetical protein